MKLMFASDIHGSLYYAKKMKCAFEEERASQLILLGDLLYHGPRNDLPKDYAPKGVIDILNSIASKILCVRGNCDTEVDQMVLDFPIVAEYAMLYLGDKKVYLAHGHHEMPKLQKGDILINGHTHIHADEDRGLYRYLNPGSVSIPKEGQKPSYMIYEDGQFTIKELI